MFIRARSIQPKFATGPTEKTGPPQTLDQFFRNFSGRNRTEISGNFGWMDRALEN